MKFRWPVKPSNGWRYLPAREHFYYSDEQYSQSFYEKHSDYMEAVAKRIDPVVYDSREKIDKVVASLTRQLNERIPIVLHGQKACSGNRCPEGSYLWDVYGTPGRDDFIMVMVAHLEEIIRQSPINRNEILEMMGRIHLRITAHHSITVRDVFENASWISSDPGATIEARWGLDKCGTISERMKNAQDSILFIEKTHGASDPAYAKRSIDMQQVIVRTLAEEAIKNNCRHSRKCSSADNPVRPKRQAGSLFTN